MRLIYFTGFLILAAIAAGCQSSPTTSLHNDASSPTPNRLTSADTPVGYLNGVKVTRDELYRVMVEAQGGQALSEILLERAITQRLKSQGIALSPNEIQAERDQLLASLDPDPNQATRLLDTMRSQRGLGELRFDSLLRRNAGLRKLVREGITVTEPAIEQAYQVRYGQRYQVRLITAQAVDTLSKARRKIIEGDSFTDLAIAISTDASAAQGGLLSPISPADATYPKAVRDAMTKLTLDNRAARLSPVIAMPDGYALLWLEGVISKDAPPLGQVRDQLVKSIRMELERVRMQQLARVMIEEANIIVLDPALDKAWRHQRGVISAP